mgnify:CR=1 FL=1
MRNTSSKFKTQIKGNREFCAKIIINYADGNSQTLTDLQDFMQIKIVDECSGTSEFEIGAAVIGEALITLNNRTGKFDGKNFYGAHISAYVGILVDGKPELLEMGHYIVDEPVSPGISIALTAYDNMILLDKLYEPKIAYPATLASIVKDACSQCGVILERSQFPRSSYAIEKAPENATCREVVAAAAQLAGCYAKARTNGRIAITWYASTVSQSIDILYGKSICTDDVTITGTEVVAGETTAKSGADGYRLSISDNILLAEDKAQETATYLGNKLIGLKFRPLSVTCKSDPSIEAGDRITVRDEKGNEYETVVTSTTFAVLESQKVACNAASPTINGGKRLSETSKAIIANRKYADEAVEHERLEREAALEEMNRQLAESSGMYITSKKQDDGSTIYYAHDKPKLDESQIVWKMTATAIGISADGGKTYPYGLDVSGKAILDRIYVIGINAENVKVESQKLTECIKEISSKASDASTAAKDATDATNAAVASVEVEYYKSTSPTQLADGKWQTATPTWAEGSYIWSRTKTTTKGGTVAYSTPVCITGSTGASGANGSKGDRGEKGDKGATGRGVKAIVPQYYLSISSTKQEGGSWSTTQPAWAEGKYIWTRSYITWDDGTTSTTTPVLASALNGLGQDLSEVKKTVTKQGSSLKVVENQIQEKVWKEDITTEIKNLRIGGRNLAQKQSQDWQSFQPPKGINQCHSFLSGIPAKIDESIPKGTKVTCTIEIKWEKCAVESGKTMSAWMQGSQDGGWNNVNPFTKNLYTYDGTASGQKIYTVTNEWDGLAHKYDIQLRCDNSDGNGIFYWRCLKAEIGDKATDWTPAPEDIDGAVDQAQSTADQAQSTVTTVTTQVESLKTATESLSKAMQSYVKEDDLETYKKQVESQLSQTPDAIEARFKTIEQNVSKVGSSSDDKWAQLETYIRLTQNGIALGKSDSPITLEIRNDRICFMQSGQVVAYYTNNQLYNSNLVVTTTANILGLVITKSGRHLRIS